MTLIDRCPPVVLITGTAMTLPSGDQAAVVSGKFSGALRVKNFVTPDPSTLASMIAVSAVV
jgi:hypothetical protein